MTTTVYSHGMLRLVRAMPLGALLFVAFTGCFFPDYTFTGKGGNGGSGGTGSPTSSTQASTVTGTSGGGGGSGPKEDCFNGIDDDDNGLADCADPACAPDTECVDPIPVGWGTFGFVVLAEGDPTTPPLCPSYAPSQSYTGESGLSGGTWSCSQCHCDAPSGQACDLKTDLNTTTPGIQPFQVRDVSCTTVSATSIREVSVPAPPWDLSCFAGAPSDALPPNQTCPSGPCNLTIRSSAPVVSGGMCNPTPTGGVATLTTPSWDVGATVCGNIANLAGCTGSQKCMPKPAGPFLQRVCIGKAGDQTCPAGAFTKKHLYYGDFGDTRGCDTCLCQDPVGGVCHLQLDVFSDDACGTPIASFDAGTCAALTGNPRVGGRTATLTQAPSGGSCQPTVLNPSKTGGVVETNPTTFCCLP